MLKTGASTYYILKLKAAVMSNAQRSWVLCGWSRGVWSALVTLVQSLRQEIQHTAQRQSFESNTRTRELT